MKSTLPIRLIWARDERGAIGKGGSLPWHLPADLAHFKAETLQTVCVMGRRTIDSLGGRHLPGRPLICMSKNQAYQAPERVGLERTITGVLMRANYLASQFPQLRALSICGGAQMYDLWWPLASEIVETVVHTNVQDPDALLPFGVCPSEATGWEVAREHRLERDSRHAHSMDFIWWRRVPESIDAAQP